MKNLDKGTIFFLLLLLNFTVYGQNNFINFERIKVEDIASIEASFNSKVHVSKLEYVESTKDSLIRYGKLKNYSRPEDKLYGKINVTYFYLKKDSLVRKISYLWSTPKSSKLKDYSKQFDKTVKGIAAALDLKIGKQGKLTDMIDEMVEGQSLPIKERRVTWEYKGAEILIIMIWSETHGAYLSTDINWEK